MREKTQKNKCRSRISAGFCLCMNCGTTISHKEGVRCRLLKCPKCGARKLIESPWQTQL